MKHQKICKQFMEIFRTKYPEEEKTTDESEEDKDEFESVGGEELNETTTQTDSEDLHKGTIVDATV